MSVDEHTIELAGEPIFYRAAPAPGTPVLYLHGVPTSSDDWSALLARTGGIAPDLIGFGRSAKGGHLDYSIESLATFVQRLLDHLGVDRVKLVAHDWGAPVGIELASRHPRLIERAVLCNPLPLLESLNRHWLARLWRRPVIGELVMGATTRGVLARALRAAAAHPERAWPDDRVAAVWSQFDQGTQRAVLRLHRRAGQHAPGTVLGAPALVIWGERDPWFPAVLADEYVEQLGDAELHRVPDAGHWPWLEDEATSELIGTLIS